MRISDIKSEVKNIVGRSERLKREIGAMVAIARILPNEHDIHDFKSSGRSYDKRKVKSC
jgi:hypothetical protein